MGRHQHEFERFEHNDRTVILCSDPDAESPRDSTDCNLATIACWHRNYNLGDRQIGHMTAKDVIREVRRNGDRVLAMMPMWIYEHSGIALRVSKGRPGYPFTCPWDSGQVGWAYVLESTARKVGCVPGQTFEHGGKTVTYDKEFFETAIRGEIDVYDRWGQGGFCGYIVKDEDGDELDSCWGFDDVNYCREEAKSAAEHTPAPGKVSGGCDARCEP